MKVKWLIGALLSVLCACTPDVQPPIVDSVQPNDSVPSTDTPAPTYEELFDIERVSAVRLLMTTDAWNMLLSNFDTDWFNDVYVPATFVYEQNGITYTVDSVGVRLRGNTSRRRPEGVVGEMHNAQSPDWHHAHFQVKFDE